MILPSGLELRSLGPAAQPTGVALVLRPVPADGALVVLNRAMIAAIDAALDEVERLKPGVFVLTSENRVFVAGADLREIMGLSDPELHDYLRFGQRVYGRIARLACPTVAALNGPALGGGLEIAMHCDVLVAAEPPAGTPEKPSKPYHIGLPEAGLGICPGWGGTNLLPARTRVASEGVELVATARTLAVTDAFRSGVVQEFAPAGEPLVDAAARAGARLNKHEARTTPRCISDADVAAGLSGAMASLEAKLGNSAAGSAVLSCIRIGLDRGWEAGLDAERENLVRLRGTPEAKAAIEAFFARSAKK